MFLVDHTLIDLFNRTSEDVRNLTKSVTMFTVKNTARKLDIAIRGGRRKHHYVFNPLVMLV